MAQLKITLKRTVAHRKPAHRRIVKALGLGRVDSSVVLPDNPAIRGQIFKIAYLLDVEVAK
ncbi:MULTISPECIES: 50S ribosomal protein L30 [Loigolactobacillus]|uniref:Large ribosomal subunit protein uL30 n=1 Tax=Loigolactobacillus backii TaxID=375175 RepID=A0A192H2G0_9LACO|nr:MULTISPECIES: 50S ribosomal protein L30 [Loigolactobacillus]ANK60139.1 50S ribosomal protein L30 [Loigolactobacillus backii]ANK62422.1 50S ribosomal protein L30 [Loigolactobacillus backii]ANK65021.1 50S ribosomal protein L30 [Loigolactobacillus backii]ANK67578.1 50S ribosomal protein L30 [Loigolactobacillus backii]ANK70566.1 50S ribosomal protein L30 [Loigolactobacillus backii]